MLRLLQDIATDVDEPIGPDNPLRQVIVNTHSPGVVQQVPDDSLLVAELREKVRGDQRFKSVIFSCLPDTWRAKSGQTPAVSRGKLLSYLNPVNSSLVEGINSVPGTSRKRSQRVVDRPDLQLLLPL